MPDHLSSKQRAHLRGLAHTVKATAHIGKEGVSSAVVDAIQQMLSSRELIKVRVLEAAPDDTRATGDSLTARIPGLHVVQSMGRVLTLYRPLPENTQGTEETKG